MHFLCYTGTMIKTIRSFLSVPVMILLIAVTTLLYSGYRAQRNQANQTARSAGFELLKSLNELQMIADAYRYTPEHRPSFLDGWTQVLLIDDMSEFIAPEVAQHAAALHHAWKENFESLQSAQANTSITSEIKETRRSLKKAIQNLH